MKRLEKAVKADLEAWGPGLVSSSLGVGALEAARRLDAGPSDRDAVALLRELRLVMRELRPAGAGESELEGFLAGITAASLR